jgi:hypothetical protein
MAGGMANHHHALTCTCNPQFIRVMKESQLNALGLDFKTLASSNLPKVRGQWCHVTRGHG